MEEERPLTAVRLACAWQPQVVLLPHVAHKIGAFLFEEDTSQWTLESAAERGFVVLLDRLLKREWPGFTVLCREKRLSAAATRGYDAPVLRWWLRIYMPNQTVVSMNLVCSLAIKNDRLHVLQWLLEEEKDQLTSDGFQECRSPGIAHYLYAHDRRLPIAVHVQSDASAEHIKWCMAVEDDKDCSFTIVWPSIMDTIQCGRMEMLQRLRDCKPKRNALEIALRLGRLDVAKRLHQTYPDLRFLDPTCGYCNSSCNGNLGEWCHKCEWKRVDLEIAQWVFSQLDLDNSRVQIGYIKKMAFAAAARGKLDVLQFLFGVSKMVLQNMVTPLFDLILNPDCFNVAATNGHLSVVQ